MSQRREGWGMPGQKAATKGEYEAYLASLKRPGVAVLEEQAPRGQPERYAIPLEQLYPKSLADLPTEQDGVRLSLRIQPGRVAGRLRLDLALTSATRAVRREVEHRWTNTLPLLFAVYVDGKAVSIAPTAFGREGGISQLIDLVAPGGRRDWSLEVDGGSLLSLLPDLRARTVTLVVRGDALEKSMSRYLIEQLRGKSNVAVKLRAEVQAVHGETHLTAIDISNAASKTVSRHDCGGLFVFIGADAETEWLPSDIARDARGYVLTGDDVVKAGRWSHGRDPYLLESSVPGVFACGDVRLSPVKRVASAVGEGSMAIAFVHQYLQHEARAAS
jgi:hypothetical protein